MKLIAAVDRNWAIGKDGHLLASIPEDMQYFREKTMGKAIIMGRKTLESFPGGRPLDGRVNIVLSKNPSFHPDGVIVFPSVGETLEGLIDLDDVNIGDVFVVGGGSIYREFLPYCETAYITKIDYAYDADTYLPNLDEEDEWKLKRSSEEKTSFDIAYHFLEYQRVKREE